MTNRRPTVSPELLARYGFADPVATAKPPPASVAAGESEKAERWTAEKRQAFKLFAPRALYLAAPSVMMWLTTQPVGGGEVKQFGGNRGFRPLKIGTMRSWRDTATRLHDVIPYVRYAKPRRLWLHNDAEIDRLMGAATDLIVHQADEGGYDAKVGHGLLNLGPDRDFDQLVQDLREVARRRQVLTWDDADLSLLIDRALRFAHAKGIAIVDHRGHGINHPDFVKLIDRAVEREWRQQFEPRQEPSEIDKELAIERPRRVSQRTASRHAPPAPQLPDVKPWSAQGAFSIAGEKQRKKAEAGPRARPGDGRRRREEHQLREMAEIARAGRRLNKEK